MQKNEFRKFAIRKRMRNNGRSTRFHEVQPYLVEKCPKSFEPNANLNLDVNLKGIIFFGIVHTSHLGHSNCLQHIGVYFKFIVILL